MKTKSKIKESEPAGDVREAYLLAKAMAKIEKETTNSTFWASIVNILKQDLNSVKVKK